MEKNRLWDTLLWMDHTDTMLTEGRQAEMSTAIWFHLKEVQG